MMEIYNCPPSSCSLLSLPFYCSFFCSVVDDSSRHDGLIEDDNDGAYEDDKFDWGEDDELDWEEYDFDGYRVGSNVEV